MAFGGDAPIKKSRMMPPPSAVQKESTITPKKSRWPAIAASAPSIPNRKIPAKSKTRNKTSTGFGLTAWCTGGVMEMFASQIIIAIAGHAYARHCRLGDTPVHRHKFFARNNCRRVPSVYLCNTLSSKLHYAFACRLERQTDRAGDRRADVSSLRTRLGCRDLPGRTDRNFSGAEPAHQRRLRGLARRNP